MASMLGSPFVRFNGFDRSLSLDDFMIGRKVNLPMRISLSYQTMFPLLDLLFQ